MLTIEECAMALRELASAGTASHEAIDRIVIPFAVHQRGSGDVKQKRAELAQRFRELSSDLFGDQVMSISDRIADGPG